MSRQPKLKAYDASHVVDDTDTAIAVGSGDVAVLATPRLLAWLEAATVAAAREHVLAESTSVGSRIELDHLTPSPVGTRVAVHAELDTVDGRRLEFGVQARHADGVVVARGRVSRVIVDRDRFGTD